MVQREVFDLPALLHPFQRRKKRRDGLLRRRSKFEGTLRFFLENQGWQGFAYGFQGFLGIQITDVELHINIIAIFALQMLLAEILFW